MWNSIHPDHPLKIIYVLGNDAPVNILDPTERGTVYRADFPESRANLKHKLFSAFRWVNETFNFQYILKSDVDVALNYTLWINALTSLEEQPVPYTGLVCYKHNGVKHPWCSGMGYVLHRSVLGIIFEFPVEDYDPPEDRTVGKILSMAGVKFTGLFFSDFKVLKSLGWPIGLGEVMNYNCVKSSVGFKMALEKIPALHFNNNLHNMLRCWIHFFENATRFTEDELRHQVKYLNLFAYS